MDVRNPDNTLAPLADFYSERSLPEIQWVDGESLPQPFQELLFHQSDMTSTLENFHGNSIHLRVLKMQFIDTILSRQVILVLDGGRNQSVEFGAIRIHLSGMIPAARDKVLDGFRPLGAILNEEAVPYSSRPSAFFKLHADEVMMDAFRLESPGPLYGRCNRLVHPSGATLAEVVEILPPLDK